MRWLCVIYLSATILFLGANAHAQENAIPPEKQDKVDVRPILLGVDIGVSIPFSKLKTTFITEIEAGYRFYFDGRLGASMSLGYTRPTTKGELTYAKSYNGEDEIVTGVEPYKSAMDVVILGIHLFYRFFDDSSWWTPWAAFGPAFFFTRHKVTSFGNTNTETGTAYGLIGTVGVDFQIGIGAITAMFRFPWAPKKNKTIGDSHLGNATFQVGYRFFF